MASATTRELIREYPVERRILAGFQGTTLPAAIRELLAQGLAGVAIYPRNFTSAEGLAALTTEIRAAASGPVLIGIDQEGGTRFSLPAPFTQWPSPAQLGALGDPDAVQEVAQAIGHELAAVGCNLDFAPMLDLHLNSASPVTQVRSFGNNPSLVARMGAAFLRGLTQGGVLGCAKHFPGHGDAQVDPHQDLPVYQGTVEQFERVDLVPFAAAISAGAPTIMIAHILLPALDPAEPASLSRKILTGLLRERMGFSGLILADDLGMGAITRRLAPAHAAVATIAAGADIAMLCHDAALIAPAIAAVSRAVESGVFSHEEWEASSKRIDRVLRSVKPAKPHSVDAIGCAAHQSLAESLRAKLSRL
jgi:beta-N-acetylhexosaminidase